VGERMCVTRGGRGGGANGASGASGEAALRET
jgi:hypothetical protein